MSNRLYGIDEHNVDYERGREDERAAIVEYLRYRAKQGADVKGWYNTFTIAWQSIKGGNHMKKVNDDESL